MTLPIAESTDPVARTPSVSVVIPAHDAAATLPDQLHALAEQLGTDTEVVVAMNRCRDDTAGVVGRFRARTAGRVRGIVANARVGASYARNAGVAAAAGRILLFCDADDVVGSGWIEELVDALDDADIVGGRLEPVDPVPPVAAQLFPLLVDAQRRGLPVHAERIRFAMSASMACTRAAFDAAGGFDERFVYGGDDVAFCYRAQLAGLRVGFAPGATCSYRLRETVGQVTRQRVAYARGASQLVAWYLPQLDRGLLGDLAGLARRFGRLTIPFPRALALRRWVLLKASVAGAWWLASARTYARSPWRLSSNGTPLVPFTAPRGLPLIGGLGLVDAAPGAVTERDGHDVVRVLHLLERAVERGDRLIVVSGRPEVVVAAARQVGRDGGLRVVVDPSRAEMIERNLEIHSGRTPPEVELVVARRPQALIAENTDAEPPDVPAVLEVPGNLELRADSLPSGRTWWRLPYVGEPLRPVGGASWFVGIGSRSTSDRLADGLACVGAERVD